MNPHNGRMKDAVRRWLFTAGSASLMLSLTACQSVLDIGIGGAVSDETSLAEIRSSHNLPALHADPALEKAALQQATYMARSGRMNHRTGWGKDFVSRMKDNGIGGAAAENIAHGAMSEGRLFSMWMNSAGHRRNMLDPRFTRFGLAYVYEAGGSKRRYWALVLAS